MADCINLERFGIIYCGGEISTFEKSQITGQEVPQSHYINHAVVHYLIPKNRTKEYPIVLIPGLCLRASLYLNTPDGRDGWAQMFLNAGYEVYIFEEPTSASASFDYNTFRPERSDESLFISFGQEEAWERWGIGKDGTPYADSQFPAHSIDEFFKSFTPVYSTNTEIFNKENPFNVKEKSRALNALLERIGPAIILDHSASSFTGFETARQRNDLVRAIITVEPVASPVDEQDILDHFTSIPFLALFGDYYENRGLMRKYESCVETARIIEQHGGIGSVIPLTQRDIFGNSHLMMIDRNNEEIATIILDWLKESVR